MAKSVLRRTVFLDGSKDQVRFYDWAMVTTTLGAMVEPRQLCPIRPAGADFDPQDELAQIDNVASIDILRQKETFLGAGDVLHGGEQIPKAYHYNPDNS